MKLSLPQQDVYYEQLLYPGEPVYNIGAKVAIEGNILYEVLSNAYTTLINQHDSYRSIVVHKGDEVEIETIEEYTFSLQFLDFSHEQFPDEAANNYMQEQFREPFNLNSGALLFKFILIRVTATFHYLFSMYHHIITDGWGTSLMFQRLVKNYNELIEQSAIAKQYPYSYKDFAEDDLQYYQSQGYEEDKKYWKSRFRELPEGLFEKINKSVTINKSSRKALVVPRPLYNQLEALAARSGCSTFHVILGVLYLYFGRKHQNTDFTIGLPVLNRGKAIFKKTVGLFMGISALRVKFSYSDSFEALLANIRQQLRQDYRHQRFPIGKLVHELGAFKEREQFFNITLSYEKQNYADHFAGTVTTVIPLTHGAERVALAIYIREFDEARDVKIDFDYNINYFDEASIAGVVTHFNQLLTQVCEQPKVALSSFDFLTGTERGQLLYGFNNTVADYSKDSTFLSLFQEQVAKRGGDIAVFDDSVKYTYYELDTISDRLAMYLLHRFPDQQLLAGVLMPRSAKLVAALLGVLKSGNAYIPLDPGFPQERLKYIIGHSKAACILGAEEFSNVTGGAGFISIDEIVNNELTACMLPEVKSSDSAYVIYTSGSTGNPKGVVIGHQALLNFLISMQGKPGLEAANVCFSVTTQSFDISMLEFFGPLISGGCVYVAPDELLFEPVAVINKLKRVQPNIIQATPGFYQMLFNAGWEGDKKLKVLCGGDLLNASLAAKLLDTCAEIWNMYGPTETTIWSSVKRLDSPEQASNIGKPVNNTQFYILDECLQLLPVGAPGNIYIGGDGLAKGYHREEALTGDRFIVSPFNPDERIYKTGDLGKWSEEGEVEFLGRSDYQVKIRGYRIESGEIEAKINALPFVKTSVVIAKKKEAQEAFLVAYAIPEGSDFDSNAISNALQKELPEYMIPHIIIPVEQFPLTPNKKIDRKLLASREIDPLISQPGYVSPETHLQLEICRLFKEALEWKGDVGITDNFFSMGGHSLNGMKLINQMQQQLGYQLALKDLFDHPSVRALAEHLKDKAVTNVKGMQRVSEKDNYALTPSQYAIWLAGQDKHKNASYNLFVVYKISGEVNLPVLQQAFIEVVKKYEILRTNFIEIQGVPVQQVRSIDKVRFQIDVISVADAQATELIEEHVNKEFNLESELLLRAGLFKTENKSLLAFCSHHIVMDGWSIELLIKEIAHNYQQSNQQKDAISFQFRDYVAWLQDISAERREINERFWNNYLRNYQWKSVAVVDPIGENLAGEYDFKWEADFYESLKSVAKQQNSTLHTFLLTAFAVLLHKLYNENDVCIGSVNSGRTNSDLHSQIGMFVKTLPLRAGIEPQQSFSQLLKTVHADLLRIDAHQDIPEPLFNTLRLDVLFVVQPPSFNYDSFDLAPDATLFSYPIAQKFSRLPLMVHFIQGGESLRCSINFDTGRYTKEEIEIMFIKYERLLMQLTETTNIEVKAIDTALDFEHSQNIDIEFTW